MWPAREVVRASEGKKRKSAALVVVVGIVTLLVSAPSSAAAQGAERAVPDLDAVEAAADAGRPAEAGGILERWFEERASSASTREISRARLLRARLTEDVELARRDYLWLTVDGAPELRPLAHLRLAQLRLARGHLQEAADNLELLRSEAPGTELEAESWLWTGRVRVAAGDTAEACRAYQRAWATARERDMTEMEERARRSMETCVGPRELEGPAREVVGEGEISIQIGAFASQETARLLERRARDAGFDVRIVRTGDDGLHRVRVGLYPDRVSAASTLRRLREAGFQTLVVTAESE